MKRETYCILECCTICTQYCCYNYNVVNVLLNDLETELNRLHSDNDILNKRIASMIGTINERNSAGEH
jgi:hypothetical protein